MATKTLPFGSEDEFDRISHSGSHVGGFVDKATISNIDDDGVRLSLNHQAREASKEGERMHHDRDDVGVRIMGSDGEAGVECIGR